MTKIPTLALQIAANAQPLGTFEKALSLVRRAVAELELLQAGGGGWSRESTA